MTNTYTNLINIIDSLPTGVTPTVTKLPTRKARKSDLLCSRVGGASTRYNSGCGAHSRVSTQTSSAMQDVR